MRLTKRQLAALEKVFSAEINGILPFQSKARIFKELAEDGLLQPYKRVFGADQFAITAHGYALTHVGRLAYCASCGQAEEVGQ